MLVRTLSCRSSGSAELRSIRRRSQDEPIAILPPKKLSPLPYDVLRLAFFHAVSSTTDPREREHLCYSIAQLSSDWTSFGLRLLYSTRLTFRKKRFPSPTKKRFSRFYRAIATDSPGLAGSVTWLKLDLKLPGAKLRSLLRGCPALRSLALEHGGLHLDHLQDIETLSLQHVSLWGDPNSLLRPPSPSPPMPANETLVFRSLTTLILSSVFFAASSLPRFLAPSALPHLKRLTTNDLITWSDTPLRDALFALFPQLTHLRILDPLRYTRHHLLRCTSLQHLSVAELPKNAASLRHVLPFLNASPTPLKSLTLHTTKIAKRSTLPDALGPLSRGLVLALCERRASVRELERLELSGPGWAAPGSVSEAVGLVGDICALRDMEMVVRTGERDVKDEWVDRAMDDEGGEG
ncbi:hypothetical protein JCM8097_000618 [Rhodosporidiobolus ruineniae]